MDYAVSVRVSKMILRKVKPLRNEDFDIPYASAWSGIGDDPIPGDGRGHFKMAFMVAEVVSSYMAP